MNPLTDLTQILIGELDKTREMFFAWFKRSKSSRFYFSLDFQDKLGSQASIYI